MPKRFEWSNYELTGPLNPFLGDYRVQAFGCDQTINHFMSSMRKIRQKNESIRWILIDFWGRGKSTLMYNFCYEINRRLFFRSGPLQVLALYVNYPHRAQELLDYTYENGLPLPWAPRKQKDDLHSLRRDLFAKALRRLAYAWLRKACCDRGFNRKCTIPFPKVDRNRLLHHDPVKTIEYLDRSPQKENIYCSLAEFLSSFLTYLYRQEKLDSEELISFRTVKYFPNLIYPESSPTFLESLFRLFSEPQRGLRNFLEFHRVCELVGVHVLVVIDEAENWNYMAKTRLDDFLIEILPTNRLSVILILRTEVINRLRGVQKKLRYLFVRSWMKQHRHIPDPRSKEILEIAKGLLSARRVDSSFKLFPFTDDFILALSNLTVRSGHFNLRMFLRSLDRILKLSLTWERDEAEIGAEYIKRSDLLDAVVENFRIEEKRELESSVIAKVEEIQKKMYAAREVSGHLLMGRVDPPTRYMFDIVKEIVSEQFQIPILDDMEIIAYSRRKDRTKVNRMIRELKEAPKPSTRVIESLKWLFLSKTK